MFDVVFWVLHNCMLNINNTDQNDESEARVSYRDKCQGHVIAVEADLLKYGSIENLFCVNNLSY